MITPESLKEEYDREAQAFREQAVTELEREAMQDRSDMETEAEGAEPSWRRPAGVLAASPQPKARFLTDFPALNRASRGGLPTGSVIVVQGEPDGGKTGFVVQTAVKIGLEHRVPVWIYTSDGGAEATATRIGGLLGLDMDKLEQRDPAELERLDRALANHQIFVVTDSKDGMTLESLLMEAEAVDPEKPHILAVDSIQETPPQQTEKDFTERDRVIANIRLLRRAKQSAVPWLVLATSEIVKSSFSSRKGSDRSRQISAGSDSAKIGYAANMVIHLTGDPDQPPDFGRAVVVKTKLGGGKPVFGLRLEKPSLRLLELDIASVAADQEERGEAEREETMREFAARVWRHLYDFGPKNTSDLEEAMRPCRKGHVGEAIGYLGPRVSTLRGPRNSKIHTAVGKPETP